MENDPLAVAVDVVPGVRMVTAPNPGPKTLDGTNTYIVGARQLVVIDPGPDVPAHAEAVAEATTGVERVTAILLTHGHPDHAAGAARLARLLQAPIWSATLAEDTGPVHATRSLGDGDEIDLGGSRLQVIAAPGHARDHLCFFLLPDRILFSGDVILGLGSTLIAYPDGDVAVYLDTLRHLRTLDARLIAPGHGPLVTDPGQKIDEYVEHRRQREAAILAVLRNASLAIDEIVERVYGDVRPEMHELAAASVDAQLRKLCREGRVERDGERYQAVS